MSMLNVRTKLSTIGLDIDDHEVRAVQLREGANGIEVQAWAAFPRLHGDTDNQAGTAALPEQDEMRWVSSILARRGFLGHCVSCAPRTRDCTQHVIELPPPESGAPLDQLARVEIARERKCAPGDFELGMWSLPQRGRSNETMAVAVAKPVVEHILEKYGQGDLDAVGIDLPELAIMRGVQDTSSLSLPQAEAHIDAVLHVGWNSALAVVTLGQRIVYVRRIEKGACHVWSQACDRFGLSPNSARAVMGDYETPEHSEELDKVRSACWSTLAKVLAPELDVAFAYVSHSFRMAPLGQVVMSGYGAMNPTLHAKLDEILGIPVACSAPSALLDSIAHPNHETLAARLTLAYGLAARFDS
jgi:Tfp pilus assembly PilM family ATPase